METSKESKARIISSLIYNYEKVGNHSIIVFEGENSFFIQKRSVFFNHSDIIEEMIKRDKVSNLLYKNKKYRKLRKQLKKVVDNAFVRDSLYSDFLGNIRVNRNNYFLYIIRK